MTMEPTQVWLLLFIVGLGTLGLRYSFIYLYGRLAFPPLVMHMLKYIPPAVLSALVWPALFLHHGESAALYGHERLLAGMLALLVAWKTSNILLTIATGLTALWLLRYFLV